MRILHLVHQYPPHYIGGTELYTQAVATAQAALGHAVAIFVPCPAEKVEHPTLPAPSREQGVSVYRIGVGERSRTQVFLQTFRQPDLQQIWRNVLEIEQPDVVHIEHLMGLPLSLAAELSERGIPYVVSLHDYWYVCANAQLFTNTDQTVCAGPDAQAINCARCALARSGYQGVSGGAPLLAPIMNRRNSQAISVLQNAGRSIAPTRFVRDSYHSMAPGDLEIELLPHGIALPPEAAKKGLVQRVQPDRKGRLRVGYIGSIAPQKGVHVLIEAVNMLAEAEVTLTIYGGLDAFPEYATALESMIDRPGIDLAGVLDREALWQAIANFDVVVLPTLWYETSVLVIDEVNALGVPVVGSDIGVMSERIKDGVNGRLFPPGDAAALRNILTELAATPAIIREWRRHIDPVYTIDEHIRALEEIYAGILNPV